MAGMEGRPGHVQDILVLGCLVRMHTSGGRRMTEYAKPCEVCKQYYPGDCKCDQETCPCDGCEALRYIEWLEEQEKYA